MNGFGCINCRFSTLQQSPPPNLGKVRFCIWGPPTAMMIPTSQGMQMASGNPQVQDAFFCHRHELLIGADLIKEPPPASRGLHLV